jgi:hypothetical protein
VRNGVDRCGKLGDSFGNFQPRADDAHRVALVRLWQTELHQQLVAQVLRHVTIVGRDDFSACALARLQQIAQLLRVEALS